MPHITVEQAMRIGVGHQRAGRLAEAEKLYRLVLQKEPNNADALQLLGVSLMQLGRGDAGIELIRRAVEIDPTSAEYRSNLGNALRETGRIDECIEACREAIKLRPDLAGAHNNLAFALRQKGRFDESIEACRTAIRLKPNFAEPHHNLGNALSLTGKFDEAIGAYREALRLRPRFAEAANNLGTALAEMGRIDESIDALRQAIRINPKYGDTYSNLGFILSNAGQLEESLVMSRRAVHLEPLHAGFHWNLSLNLLSQGIYREGWPEFEWRLRCTDLGVPRRDFHQPIWKGEDLQGRTILLHFEQGLGDTIQLVRYAPLVEQRGGRAIVLCQRELARLLRSNPELGQIITPDDEMPPFDFHCPLFSLPLAFKTEMNSIPAGVPYLRADAPLVEAWGQRLESARGRWRIGLVWAGRPSHKRDRHRSMEFSKLLPLAEIGGAVFVNLQKGPAAEQARVSPGMELIDFAAELDDFGQTAALISNLDLVVGVDTAVIHLAAAMGKPTWVLLPFVSDWRWLRRREDSPWYPTLRLFRQKTFGDWNEVIRRVVGFAGQHFISPRDL